MKKIVFTTVILTAAIVVFFGCKKGPDDPWFSIHSRKARVVGDWNATVYTVNDSDRILYTISGTLPTGGCGTATYTNTINNGLEFNFAKDGTYELTKEIKTTTDETFSGGCAAINTVQDSIQHIKGVWTFSGGTDRTKYKEMLSLFDANKRITETYKITYLANKEIRLMQQTTDTAGYYTKTIIVLDPK